MSQRAARLFFVFFEPELSDSIGLYQWGRSAFLRHGCLANESEAGSGRGYLRSAACAGTRRVVDAPVEFETRQVSDWVGGVVSSLN